MARESSGKGSRYGQYVLGELYRFAAAHNLDWAQHSLGCTWSSAFVGFVGFGVAEDHAEALRL